MGNKHESVLIMQETKQRAADKTRKEGLKMLYPHDNLCQTKLD